MHPVEAAKKAVLRPLAASTYLRRNAGKTVPLTAVIMLAVLLISGIVSLINSIPYSIRTIYQYTQQTLAITPRGDAEQTPKLVADVKANAPVPIERIMLARAAGTQVVSIVGKWPFAVLALKQPDMQFWLDRQGVKSLDGRLPKAGEPEALISEPVARNLNLKLGSNLLSPNDNESFSPFPVKVVGIAKTPMWLMLTNYEYVKANHFPDVDVMLAFAHTLKDQDTLDRWASKHFKGERAQIFAYHQLEQQTDDMFNILYKILNVVIATLVFVITLMMGMLINIYLSQRLVEFGLLQALGYTKRQLLYRVLKETVSVVLIGWIFGVLLAYGLLRVTKAWLMDPRAFALDPLDPTAFLYTIPIPVAILAVASLTLIGRFQRFDPVGIVERRLV
ncbi:MAG TPA: FtsX-like permease family protein [Fimbriimonadaceae bacterium]|nr:FtsX-like permease family protein [Fimbriimonadaceae bacterium]